MSLDPNAQLSRRSALPQATIGASEIVLLDTSAGKYHGLKGPAARIWELLETPTSLAKICERLVAEFEVEPDVCRQDVESFVGQLIGENLVVVSN